MEFSCNGHLMGEEFDTSEAPSIKIKIHGTAPIRKVTLIRNEQNYEVWEPSPQEFDFSISFKDEKPKPGKYRYYLRVEQIDGNMGWTSPLWVNVK
jgi:hypothetical protein